MSAINNIAIAVIRDEGLPVARKLHKSYPSWDLWMPISCNPESHEKGFDSPFKNWLSASFDNYQGFVCFMAVGIVVRSVSSMIPDKLSGPGIVVCDEFGRHAISLLGGHEGGANSLAFAVANKLGANPVITTGTESVKPYILGIGCRKNASYEGLEKLTLKVLEKAGVPFDSIRCVASIDLKEDEPCLIKLTETHNWPLRIFTKEEILTARLNITPSDFVKDKLGVPGVCEPTALIASHFGEIIIEKMTENGCAVALIREKSVNERRGNG